MYLVKKCNGIDDGQMYAMKLVYDDGHTGREFISAFENEFNVNAYDSTDARNVYKNSHFLLCPIFILFSRTDFQHRARCTISYANEICNDKANIFPFYTGYYNIICAFIFLQRSHRNRETSLNAGAHVKRIIARIYSLL